MRRHSFILGRRDEKPAWFCQNEGCNAILSASEDPDKHLKGCPMKKTEDKQKQVPLIEGVPRLWQHANHNANHPDGYTVFECRQVDENDKPLGFIEVRPVHDLGSKPKIFPSVDALKENWDW